MSPARGNSRDFEIQSTCIIRKAICVLSTQEGHMLLRSTLVAVGMFDDTSVLDLLAGRVKRLPMRALLLTGLPCVVNVAVQPPCRVLLANLAL